jgi:hypothetical protein
MSRKSLSLICVIFSAPLFAQDVRQIIEESQRRGRTSSQRYEGVIEVTPADGKTTSKSWQSLRLGAYGNSKAVLRFTAPAEIKGVALLIINHPDRASDQWMWTPAIARDRRIALQDRTTRFFGTDFSFEDLEERDVDQFDYKLSGEETIDSIPCWRINAHPRQGKSSQYSLSRIWITKDHYVAIQYENFVKEQLARRLHAADVANVQGIWTARTLEMTDLRRKSRTVLRMQKLEYNIPLKDDEFTVQSLRRDQ